MLSDNRSLFGNRMSSVTHAMHVARKLIISRTRNWLALTPMHATGTHGASLVPYACLPSHPCVCRPSCSTRHVISACTLRSLDCWECRTSPVGSLMDPAKPVQCGCAPWTDLPCILAHICACLALTWHKTHTMPKYPRHKGCNNKPRSCLALFMLRCYLYSFHNKWQRLHNRSNILLK